MRVLQLTGSPTSAFMADLSRLYARDCLEVLGDRWSSVLAYVSPDGAWRFPDDLDDAALDAAPPLAFPDALARVAALGVDAMVPQMFCREGMTAYRALFELLGIPYLGNRPEAMALTVHKARAKAVVAAAGVATPEGVVVGPGAAPPALALPVVVKPVDGDNSHGVTLVRDRAGLGAAIAEACAHGSAALVERFVELGREVRCGVLERDGELVVLPLEEYDVDAEHKPVRPAADKLGRGEDGQLALMAKTAERAWILPADDPATDAVGAAARTCHRALGCRHYSLFDFRVDPEGRPWFLEAGLYCSFARGSVIAVMAQAAGIETDELFATVLAAATAPEGTPPWTT